MTGREYSFWRLDLEVDECGQSEDSDARDASF
jgi:hypothetical protein